LGKKKKLKELSWTGKSKTMFEDDIMLNVAFCGSRITHKKKKKLHSAKVQGTG
jgi:hypothetical protein